MLYINVIILMSYYSCTLKAVGMKYDDVSSSREWHIWKHLYSGTEINVSVSDPEDHKLNLPSTLRAVLCSVPS